MDYLLSFEFLYIDLDLLLQTIISLMVITSPFDPTKLLIFTGSVGTNPKERKKAASKLSLYVFIILALSALVGYEFLKLMGIELIVFSMVGGLIIVLMGFEMFYGGGASRAQGEGKRQIGPEDDDSLLIPLALPLIAGPGAITTVITLASQSGNSLEILIAVAAVGVVTYLSYTVFTGFLLRAKPRTIKVMVRIGGLLLATIGAQMILTGLKNFFIS